MVSTGATSPGTQPQSSSNNSQKVLFCSQCGSPLAVNALFCSRCGKQIYQSYGENTKSNSSVYHGMDVLFTFAGQSFTIPAEYDCFNHYRRIYRKLAKTASERLRNTFNTQIRSLDAFLENFWGYYLAEREPILKQAYGTLEELGYYDISLESFTNQHTADFCLIKENLDAIIRAFNETIEANQVQRANNFNLIPGIIVGGGIGGFVTAFALNAGMSAIEKSVIANANVTSTQRMQLFKQIDVDVLMYRVYADYWRVFCSMTFIMKNHGFPVWYPNGTESQRTINIASNLNNGRIPESKIPEVVADVITTFPYNDDFFLFLYNHYPFNPELAKIYNYYGFDGKTMQ